MGPMLAPCLTCVELRCAILNHVVPFIYVQLMFRVSWAMLGNSALSWVKFGVWLVILGAGGGNLGALWKVERKPGKT